MVGSQYNRAMKRLTIGLLFLFMAACGSTEKSATEPKPAAAPAAKPADEGAALRILGEINAAQAEYIKRHRRYALTYEELMDARLIQQDPSKDAAGYDIKLRPAADAGSYTMVAVPVSASASERSFFTDKTGTIRAEQGKDANAASPEVPPTPKG